MEFRITNLWLSMNQPGANKGLIVLGGVFGPNGVSLLIMNFSIDWVKKEPNVCDAQIV
jgi:hypothetical protein